MTPAIKPVAVARAHMMDRAIGTTELEIKIPERIKLYYIFYFAVEKSTIPLIEKQNKLEYSDTINDIL